MKLPTDKEALSRIERERRVLELVSRNNPRFDQVVPRVVDRSDLFATVGIDSAVTLRSHHESQGRVNPKFFFSLGFLLGTLHSMRQEETTIAEADLLWLAGAQPDATPDLLAEESKGALLFRSFVNETDAIARQFSHLQRAYERSSCIHNDLKWDNILVHPRNGETEPTEIKIIDWEMAGIGDPCWDVGTVLSEFVAFWALSIPVVGGEPYEGLAKYPIEDMQPAIQAFWKSYGESMEFDPATEQERLIKSARFAGARLIQTAYERTQTMTHLTAHIYLLLQLSLNIMEQAEEAAEGLFGLSIPPAGR